MRDSGVPASVTSLGEDLAAALVLHDDARLRRGLVTLADDEPPLRDADLRLIAGSIAARTG